MKRRTLLSTLAVMFAALVMAFTATTNEASAQSYTVDVAGVPAACFPFNICTYWSAGFPPPVPIAGNGVTVHPIAWGCPPATTFFGASINCLFPIAAFNNPQVYNVNGCCLVVRIAFDAAGCPYIHVRLSTPPC